MSKKPTKRYRAEVNIDTWRNVIISAVDEKDAQGKLKQWLTNSFILNASDVEESAEVSFDCLDGDEEDVIHIS